MNYSALLEDWQQTFDTYLELGVSDYDYEVEQYEEFYDEYEEYFNNEERELCVKIYELILVAGEHFDAVAAQEELDEIQDQRSYLGSEGNH